MKLKINQIFDFEKGSLQSLKNISGKYDFITAGEGWKTHNEFTHDGEFLIFAMGASGSLGRTHYIKGKFISSDLCFIISPKSEYKNKINLKFYHTYFNLIKADVVKNIATGTSKIAINRKNFGNYELFVPQIDFQNSFIDKFIKIKKSNDKLLNIMDENKNYIKLLKQSILQEAIEGKLTKSWREKNKDIESASVLLEKIKAEKEELIKQKKLKKQKELNPILEDEIPFEIPEKWEWVRLGNIGKIVGGGTPKTSQPEYFTPNEIPWLTPADLKGNKEKYISNGRKYISNLGLSKSSAQLLPKGTVLFSSRAPIGYVRISNNELSTNQGFKSIIPFIDIYSEYLYYFLLKSGKEIDQKATGATFKEVSGTEVSRVLFPLPSLQEQKEIVKKVNELMILCDELEKQTLETKENSENLMKAVLGEVFKK